MSPEAGWTGWLSGLESAAEQLERELAAGGLPEVESSQAPAGSLPAALADRARPLLARLEQLTTAIEERRDALAGELSRLAPPRPRASSYGSWDDGAGLDITG
jgi:hypothetical protein